MAVVPEDEAPTMPLLGGIVRPEGLPEAADLDLTALKSPGRTLNQGTMLIVAAFAVAAGSVWAMKMGSSASAAPGDPEIDKKFEQTLIQLTNPDAISPDSGLHPANLKSIPASAEDISRRFATDYTQRQVPIEYVKKNPFRLALVKAPQDDGPVVAVDNAAAQRLKALQAEFNKLKLQTIMRGRPNVAVINDEICREGQKVGTFTIARIDQLSVELTAENQTFTLKMDTGPDKPLR